MIAASTSVWVAPLTLVVAACTVSFDDESFNDDEPWIPCEAPAPGCTPEDCDAGRCPDDPEYACDSSIGEWVETGRICELEIVDPVGELVLEQSVIGAPDGCPTLAPRLPMQLSVDASHVVTAPEPVVVVESAVLGNWGITTLLVTLVDDWAGYSPTVEYELEITSSGTIRGGAVLNDGICNAELEVTGLQCPLGVELCRVLDGGWSVRCAGGEIFSDEHSRYYYCAPGSTDEVCSVGGQGHTTLVATCPGGCVDGYPRSFETPEEYAAFDPVTLCAP